MTLNGVEDDSFKDLIYHLDPRALKPTSKLLVVKLFEKSPPIKDFMAKVRAIVNSFGHSHTAVAALMARTGGLELISDNTTRWSSTLLMAERMVKIQAAVETMIVVEKLVKLLNVSQDIQVDIVVRFGEWLNHEHLTFDPIMMVATLLHPALRRLLTEKEQTMAMSVLQYDKKWNSTVNDDSSGSTNTGD
ncbi:hypothetical protein RvY_03685 [Ramazzottius varieornatus]|uniref:Uncharacterized protein n=1 Tax=Ramazzottius varieornatus TaxID=947166 RepID=A0A1D1UNZ7_RAMVA|nr:hypothetical protein RvY_03685 [Ramazzottius varieornatus]